MTRQNPSRLRTWFQLFRAPNLFTVPGDPLAGYFMANSGFLDWSLACAIAASFCFYAAGLLMNDLADEAEDRRDRPNRPLPSGQVARGSVIAAMLALCALGLLALLLTQRTAAVAVGLLLIGAIVLYNFLTKHWPVIGAMNMGACRGLSVMLGGFAGPLTFFRMAGFPAVAICVYIAAVTNLARHETRSNIPVVARILPALAGLLGSGAVFFGCAGSIRNASSSPALLPALVIFVCVEIWLVWLGTRLFQSPAVPLPPLIGAHIRVLLPIQAAFCYTGDPWGIGRTAAILLLLSWPVSRAVSKRFYAS